MAAYVSNVAHGTLVLILHPPPKLEKQIIQDCYLFHCLIIAF